MTEAIVPVATGYSIWRVLCGDGPVSKAIAKLVETFTDQCGQGAQSANDWLKARARIAETRAAITVESLKAAADHEAKLFKLLSQEERATAFHVIQSNRRQRNIENVLALAGEELRDTPDQDVGDKKVDPDWTTQFFNGAQDVSNEDMQKLWAKLLAGEVKQPGSFKLRTLENLRSLSKEDAAAFARLCSVVWRSNKPGNAWAFTEGQYLLGDPKAIGDTLDFSFSDCLGLEECGLISTDTNFSAYLLPSAGIYMSYFW